MNNLTSCRAYLIEYIETRVPVPVKADGDTAAHPARQYIEIRVNGPETQPGIQSKFTLNVLVITLPASDSNAYVGIDLANQIHDLLQDANILVPDVGCLVQDGKLWVHDFGYVDLAKTIKQATVTCYFILET